MSGLRFHFSGLFAVVLALMAQLGSGSSVPRFDALQTVGVLCHTDDDSSGAPSQAPAHKADCPLCPLCITTHFQATALLSASPIVTPPAVLAAVRSESPPPSTAPPSRNRPPGQPRAPPIFS
jgi:hypothetical protein